MLGLVSLGASVSMHWSHAVSVLQQCLGVLEMILSIFLVERKVPVALHSDIDTVPSLMRVYLSIQSHQRCSCLKLVQRREHFSRDDACWCLEELQLRLDRVRKKKRPHHGSTSATIVALPRIRRILRITGLEETFKIIKSNPCPNISTRPWYQVPHSVFF